jgi:hypothetical protein
LNCPFWKGFLFNLYRKEKIVEKNTVHFLFEKTNNPDVNPELTLADQNPAVLERLIRGIQRKDLGLYCSNSATREGLAFSKYLIEQYGFSHAFFTFSIAENKLDWILNILKGFYEWDESPFNLRKDKIKGTEELQAVELTAQ